MIAFKTKSYVNKIAVSMKITINTTIDDRNNSPRLGQETFPISFSTEIKNSAKRGMLTTRNAAQAPTAKTINGTTYFATTSVEILSRNPGGTKYSPNSGVAPELIVHAPTATAASNAKNVACRAILPWFRLYREAVNIPAINSATLVFPKSGE